MYLRLALRPLVLALLRRAFVLAAVLMSLLSFVFSVAVYVMRSLVLRRVFRFIFTHCKGQWVKGKMYDGSIRGAPSRRPPDVIILGAQELPLCSYQQNHWAHLHVLEMG